MNRLLCLAFLLSALHVSHAQIQINEIMQSNIDCVFDDLNDYPDSWVELYNTGSAEVNLSNYKIGLSSNPGKAWQLPSSVISANGFVLVYCDKVASGIHTDFRLDSDRGATLYLFKDNQVVDKFTNIPEQPAPNISFGRKNETSDEIGYQCIPTPLTINCNQISNVILGEPIFSIKGFVSATKPNEKLELSLPENAPENAVIRYTTDGSEPTENSNLYSSSIRIVGTRVIRAKVFCDGYLSRPSTCQSYIYHTRNVTLPVVSIVTDNANFYDNKKGIYVDGTYSSQQKNYKYDWRRPINIEYFVPDEDVSVINQLGETRVSGGQSREAQLKSLIVYANKRFGKKRLKYEFFPEQRPGIEKYKSIMLRNAGNDFDYLYMRDAIIQRSVAEHVDLDWQAWQPAIFYFNGKYMGMLNVRERSNEDNVWTNYDGLEDIDMFENSQLKAGDWNDFNSFRDFYLSHDHTYAEYAELMDINEFQNYNLMQLYFNNQDWPANNNVIWKPKREGGKWRWIAKDTDFGLGLYGNPSNYNTMDWFYDNSYDSDRNWGNTSDATRLFRRLMEIDQFKWEFLDKVAVYTGDFISADSVKALMDKMHEEIKFEYPNHRNLFNPWWPNYDNELNNAKNWITNRAQYFFNQLSNKYSVGKSLTGKINNQLSATDYNSLIININNIPLTGGRFNGRFFNGRKLTIDGTCTDESKVITGWTVVAKGTNNQTTTTNYDGSTFTFTPSNLSNVTINAILEDATGIDDLFMANTFNVYVNSGHLCVESNTAEDIIIYNANGQQILRMHHSKNADTSVRPGIYIVKYGSKSKKIVVE